MDGMLWNRWTDSPEYAFYDLYKKLNYPAPWIEEGENYKTRVKGRIIKAFHYTNYQIKSGTF